MFAHVFPQFYWPLSWFGFCVKWIHFIRVVTKIASLAVRHSTCALLWRHNGHDSVSNHQPHGCLLNRLFRRRSKKTSKLRVTGLCVGNSPGPVNSPHKVPDTRKMFPFDDVIMANEENPNNVNSIYPAPNHTKYQQSASCTCILLGKCCRYGKLVSGVIKCGI